MTQESSPNLLTLEQILNAYQPKEETFRHQVGEGEDVITASVRRDENGQIVYVTPKSAKYIQKALPLRTRPSSAE